jgi:hypothetical protein
VTVGDPFLEINGGTCEGFRGIDRLKQAGGIHDFVKAFGGIKECGSSGWGSLPALALREVVFRALPVFERSVIDGLTC